jgi:hypothetical protein
VFESSYASGTRQLVPAIVTAEMLSQHGVYSYISDKLCIPSTVQIILWY